MNGVTKNSINTGAVAWQLDRQQGKAWIRASCLRAAPCLLREGQVHLCGLVVVAEGQRRGLGGQRGGAEEAVGLCGVGEEVDHQRLALVDDPEAADARSVMTCFGALQCRSGLAISGCCGASAYVSGEATRVHGACTTWNKSAVILSC